MLRNTCLLLCLLACSVASAQTKAVITGPKEALSGDLVILDASQSVGSKQLWKMLEADKSFLPIDGGLKCVFAAGVDSERTFHFVLVVAGTNNNGGPDVDIATHDLLMKPRGTPQPGPSPQPNPTPPDPTPGKIVGALILLETADLTPEQAIAISDLRKNAELSRKVSVLDKDAKTAADDQPVKQVARALEWLGDKQLPRVLGVLSDGSFSVSVELPAKASELTALLRSWGL